MRFILLLGMSRCHGAAVPIRPGTCPGKASVGSGFHAESLDGKTRGASSMTDCQSHHYHPWKLYFQHVLEGSPIKELEEEGKCDEP